MKEIIFKLDVDRKDKHQITSAGFLVVDANLTRAGVFNYHDEDGKLVRELRSPEEVFKQESLDSLKFAPLTKNHPKDMVNTGNAKQVQVGSVGENIVKKGDFVSGKVVINDKKEIEEILAKWDRGEDAELSMGYEAEVVDISGSHHKDGEYDKMQTNIFYNHASIVDKGRAGSNVKLIMDAVAEVEKLNSKTNMEEKKMIKIKRDGIAIGKFKLDSIMEEVEDGAKGVVDVLLNHLDSATDALAFMQKDNDELQAKHDETVDAGKILQGKYDELSDPTSPVIQTMIKDRADLEAVAKQVDVKVDHEDGKAKDSKTIKIDIISKVHPDFKADEKSDVYIGARFDAVLEMIKTDKDGKAAATLGGFRKDAKDSEGKEKKEPSEKFNDAMKDYHNKTDK